MIFWKNVHLVSKCSEKANFIVSIFDSVPNELQMKNIIKNLK
jgi:hypothetical protein